MRSTLLPMLAAAALFVTAACHHNPTDPIAAGPNLQTDKSTYVAAMSVPPSNVKYTVIVVARFTNEGDAPIYLESCGGGGPVYSVQLAGDTTHDSAFDPIWACAGGVPPVTVAPGAARSDTLRLVGPVRENADGTPVGSLTGAMRIVYQGGPACGSGGPPCLVLANHQSNVITIQLPPQ